MSLRLLQVTALAAFFCAPAAHAAISLVNYDGFAIVQSGNSWNFHHESAENSALKGGTIYGRNGSAVSTDKPLTVTSRDVVPVGKGAVVDVEAKIPRANMAKALVASAKLAGAIALPTVAGLALDAMLDYGLKNVRLGDNGSVVADGDPANSEVSTGQIWKWNAIGGSWPTGNTPEGACAKAAGGGRYEYSDYFCKAWDAAGSYLGGAGVSSSAGTCPAGKYIWPDGNCSPAPAPMTEQELSDFLASRTTGWPTSSALALAGMLQYPDTRKILTPYPDNGVTLIGPPSAQGKTSTNTDTVQLVPGTNTVAPPGSTQTQTGTRTSTTTTNHPLSYSGNSVTHSTVNNTTTNITNNTTNVTTTETKTEEIKDDEKPDECQKNPDRLGCQKVEFDTPEGEIPRKQIDVSWSPVDLGLGDGSCPAPVQLGPDKQFSYQATCDNLHIIKPLVIAVALFIGGMIIFGGRADQ